MPNTNSPFSINLTSIHPYSRDFPFLNLVKHGYPWVVLDSGPANDFSNQIPKSSLTADGHLGPGVTGMMAVIWDSRLPWEGDYVLTWDGVGTFEFATDWVGQGNQTSIISSTSNRIEFSIPATTGPRWLILKVTSNDSVSPIDNIRLVTKEHEFLNQTFRPSFLTDWAPFKNLRFMDFMRTNNSTFVTWEDYPANNYLHQTAVSFNYMVELANLLDADPWFCIPLLANDDFVTQAATYIRDNLNPNLRCYVELSNEVWNGQFTQHQQAAVRARELGLYNTGNNWEDGPSFVGYRTAQIENIFNAVFDQVANPPKFSSVIAWHAENRYFFSRANHGVLAHYQNVMGPNTAPDCVATAPYFGGNLGHPENEAVMETWTVDKVLDQLEFETYTNELPRNNGQISVARSVGDVTAWADYLNSLPAQPRLIAYEGGQHLSGVGVVANNQTITDLFLAANRHPRMADIYIHYHNEWRTRGGELFSIFSSVFGYGMWGAWGIKESMYHTREESPKYDAVLSWQEDNPAEWQEDGSFIWASEAPEPTPEPTPPPTPGGEIVDSGEVVVFSYSDDDFVVFSYEGMTQETGEVQDPDPNTDVDTFSLQPDITDAELGSTHTRTVTVSGPDAGVSVPVSVSNAEVSINGGGYTTTPGEVQSGGTLEVRATAPSSYDDDVVVTLTIGNRSATWVITTLEEEVPEDPVEPEDPVTTVTITSSYNEQDQTISVQAEVEGTPEGQANLQRLEGSDWVVVSSTPSAPYEWIITLDSPSDGDVVSLRVELDGITSNITTITVVVEEEEPPVDDPPVEPPVEPPIEGSVTLRTEYRGPMREVAVIAESGMEEATEFKLQRFHAGVWQEVPHSKGKDKEWSIPPLGPNGGLVPLRLLTNGKEYGRIDIEFEPAPPPVFSTAFTPNRVTINII
jgi:hypothetical protein